jgi:hypothetical protein
MTSVRLTAALLLTFSLANRPLPVVAADPAAGYTSSAAGRLAALSGSGLVLVKKIDGGLNGQDQLYFRGVPDSVRRSSPAEIGLMRHWTSNAAGAGEPVVDLIVKSGSLKAGPRFYIVPQAHSADYYQDLHGVFFTTPDFPPEQLRMGLGPDSDYVDFTVTPDMGALYLSPGNYLFPCPMKVRGWVAEAYKKWKDGGIMPPELEGIFGQIEREGGLTDPIDIPITVVRYRKGGKVTALRRPGRG